MSQPRVPAKCNARRIIIVPVVWLFTMMKLVELPRVQLAQAAIMPPVPPAVIQTQIAIRQ